MIRAIIGYILILLALIFSGYNLYLFFTNYSWDFLILSILFPILSIFLTTPHIKQIYFILILLIVLIFSFFSDESVRSLLFYFIMFLISFKLIRWLLFLNESLDFLTKVDQEFLISLVNSEWFKNNKNRNPSDVDVEELLNLPFFAMSVKSQVDYFYYRYKREMQKIGYEKNDLLNIFAISIVYSLPNPIIKTSEGYLSTGRQMLQNLFGNLKQTVEFGIPKLSYIEDKSIIINSIFNMKENAIDNSEELVKLFTYKGS